MEKCEENQHQGKGRRDPGVTGLAVKGLGAVIHSGRMWTTWPVHSGLVGKGKGSPQSQRRPHCLSALPLPSQAIQPPQPFQQRIAISWDPHRLEAVVGPGNQKLGIEHSCVTP